MRYHINQGNRRLYAAAFYADICIECTTTIEEGDPLGYIREPNENTLQQYGPLCNDCLDTHGRHTLIEIETRDHVNLRITKR